MTTTIFNSEYLTSVNEVIGINPIERIDILTSDTRTYLMNAVGPLRTLGGLLGSDGEAGKLLHELQKAICGAIESYGELHEIVTGSITNNDDDV